MNTNKYYDSSDKAYIKLTVYQSLFLHINGNSDSTEILKSNISAGSELTTVLNGNITVGSGGTEILCNNDEYTDGVVSKHFSIVDEITLVNTDEYISVVQDN